MDRTRIPGVFREKHSGCVPSARLDERCIEFRDVRYRSKNFRCYRTEIVPFAWSEAIVLPTFRPLMDPKTRVLTLWNINTREGYSCFKSTYSVRNGENARFSSTILPIQRNREEKIRFFKFSLNYIYTFCSKIAIIIQHFYSNFNINKVQASRVNLNKLACLHVCWLFIHSVCSCKKARTKDFPQIATCANFNTSL